MKEPEILSRATAFLLSVDGSDAITNPSAHDHLRKEEIRQEWRRFRQLRGHSRVVGDEDRPLVDMGYLEYVPREVRPNVHVVTSSHVLSPFLWKDYYPQEWLSSVRQEHCSYTLEVYDDDIGQDPLIKLPLDSKPFHHPEGRDIALVHFRNERESLKQLKELDLEILHLRSPEKRFQKGETVCFEGFSVQDDVIEEGKVPSPEDSEFQDNRVFRPFVEKATLDFHSEDRFFATTSRLLPGGLCGAPALDSDGKCCGTVEGIVPMSHANKKLAGTAAFMPSFVMQVFIDFVERGLVESMMPADLFQMVETAKKTNTIGGGIFRQDEHGTFTTETNWEQEYDKAMSRLKERYSERELTAIMNVVRDERDEVLKELEEQGGDMDDIIQRVRQKTMETKAMIHDQIVKHLDATSNAANKTV